jgi:hypothetical protein
MASATTGTYNFELFSNGAIIGPFTTAYNANDLEIANGSESWKVLMAVWNSIEDYE